METMLEIFTNARKLTVEIKVDSTNGRYFFQITRKLDGRDVVVMTSPHSEASKASVGTQIFKRLRAIVSECTRALSEDKEIKKDLNPEGKILGELLKDLNFLNIDTVYRIMEDLKETSISNTAKWQDPVSPV